MAVEIESHQGDGTFVKATETALVVTEESDIRLIQ